MNEITRIHIAKTAYDIEIAAKKHLEQYMKNLESYAQDKEVVTDIEIRITELLAERGIKSGGVITAEDVAAVRAQLGEPYEFASETGDMALGPEYQATNRRLYRSTDNAVLGGVLSGMAAYFNVNPLWTRLVFVLLLFVSFGTALIVYIILWIVLPPARTAAEKLQLAGQDVTLESIKRLSISEDKAEPNRVAPILQTILSVGAGTLSGLAALGVLIGATVLLVGGLIFGVNNHQVVGQLAGLDDGSQWIAWVLMFITVFGLILLASLLSLIAYAFFAKKLTKKMIISGSIIIVLGISSVSTVLGVSSVQSSRIIHETRSMAVTKKETLPKDFSAISSLKLDIRQGSKDVAQRYTSNPIIRYVVDNGPARYELVSLPGAKVDVTLQNNAATILFDVPDTFRNMYLQPSLTVYGPALKVIENNASQAFYKTTKQDDLDVNNHEHQSIALEGAFGKVSVKGSGSVSMNDSTVSTLIVASDQQLAVSAGTVRELTITQPDACPSYADQDHRVQVSGVASGVMMLNGTTMPAKTIKTNCAHVVVGGRENY